MAWRWSRPRIVTRDDSTRESAASLRTWLQAKPGHMTSKSASSTAVPPSTRSRFGSTPSPVWATVPELVAPAVGVIQDTRDRVTRSYGSAVGRHRHDVITPALLLDLPAARRNIEKMANRLKAMPAKLRPHIKVHKSPDLARLQVDAGAIGISTATVWEAVVMVRSGLDGIFIVNTVAGREKLAAIAAIAREADVMVAVDDAENAADVAKAARAAASTVGVLIEVDTGMDRAGVDTTEQAIELGQQ